jgi:hypothetical protein
MHHENGIVGLKKEINKMLLTLDFNFLLLRT